MRLAFHRSLPAWSLQSLFVLVACSSASSPPSLPAAVDSGAASGAPGTLDEPRLEALAAQFKTFAKINKVSYPTRQHAGNPLVDVYANPIAEPTYRAIDFGVAPDGRVALRPGSMLVKAMLDPNGAPPILTVMYKKASGYDPTHDDWWYGRLNADGSPTDAAFVGKVDFCVACHGGAATTDYAWGVSSSNK